MDASDVFQPATGSALPSFDEEPATGGLADAQIHALYQAGVPVGSGSARSRSWQPPGVEELQQALPSYDVLALIARGGMGAVYKGVQKALCRLVAIKVLPPELMEGGPEFASRFQKEAQAMAGLSHPGIVSVFDAGQTSGGLLYFAMEYVEGMDLARLIADEGRIESGRAAAIVGAVCEALDFAHEGGIIHRDVKPSNIMLDGRGRVKVTDFGLMKATGPGAAPPTGSSLSTGTPDFIAPETFMTRTPIDRRADIYAVGVMLYQMLTGSIPRGRFQLPSVAVPGLDPAFDAIVDKAMQTDRERRYATALLMKADLERIGAPKSAASPSTASRRRLTAFVSALAVAAAIGGFSWWLLNPPAHERPLASVVTAAEEEAPSMAEPGATDGAGEPWPQPERWVDVTESLRARYLKSSSLTESDDGWLQAAKCSTFALAADQSFRNVLLRVHYSGRADIALRRTGALRYNAAIHPDRARLEISGKERAQPLTDDRPVRADGRGSLEHEAVFAAQGDLLTLWVDGQRIASTHDLTLSSGTLALSLTHNDPFGDGRIKKVEYGELPDGILVPLPISRQPLAGSPAK